MLNRPLSRRQWLHAGWVSPWVWHTSPGHGAPPAPTGERRLIQFIDTSPWSQGLSRDYAAGLRLAWRALARPAQPLKLQTWDINTRTQSARIRDAVLAALGDPNVLGLVGTAGDALAVALHGQLRQNNARVAHVAPWMSDSRFDSDRTLACLFASRKVQLTKCLASVRGMGLNELCIVYRSGAEQQLYDAEISALARAVSLRLVRVTLSAGTGLVNAAAQIPSSSSLVFCLGGTADVAELTQGMSSRSDRRFVLGLSDVDANTLQEFNPGRGVPVILAQVVPNPARTSPQPLPLVQDYRAQLKTQLDEPPNTASLAGYIAGSYAAELVNGLGATLSRESLLAEVERRSSRTLRGWSVEFKEDQRGSRFVTQLMLGADGKLVG